MESVNENFNEFEVLENKEFPLATKYSYMDAVFYVEPMFFTQMQGMKTLRKEDFPRLWEHFKNIILKYKKVIFTADFEAPYIRDLDDFIYREITDLSDPLQIFVEDKSRGSDYGD